eukprot:10004147-Alexandrium_andersonii.AAC.1
MLLFFGLPSKTLLGARRAQLQARACRTEWSAQIPADPMRRGSRCEVPGVRSAEEQTLDRCVR